MRGIFRVLNDAIDDLAYSLDWRRICILTDPAGIVQEVEFPVYTLRNEREGKMHFVFRLKQLTGVVSLAWQHSHMQGQLPYAGQAEPGIWIANARHQILTEPSVSSPSSNRYYVTWASKMTLLQSIVRFGQFARQVIGLEFNYHGLRWEAEALAPVFVCRE